MPQGRFMKNIGLIDTHSHLNFKAFAGDFLKVAKCAQEAGLKHLIIPGSDTATSKRAIEVAREINNLMGEKFANAAVGIHPVKLSPAATSNGASPIHVDDPKNFAEIEELSSESETIAIGEAGIDRFHLKKENDIAGQKELFKKHIDLALKTNKPLIIHNREADQDILAVFKDFEKFPRMVFHCFSSDWGFAQEILGLGAFISFTGNITYGNKKIKKVVEQVPLDRVMLDSDSPYLVPEPLRSQGVKRNEPAYVIEIARKIAEIKNISLEEVSSQTTKNAEKFFNI